MTETIHESLAGNEAVADLAVLAVPAGIDDDDSEEPVLAARGVLRVAARFTGEPTLERRNRMSDGRLAVARMIGYGPNCPRRTARPHRVGHCHLPSRGARLQQLPTRQNMRRSASNLVLASDDTEMSGEAS